MSAVEELREAAAKMRVLAEAATPGPWTYEDAPNGFAPIVVGYDMAVAETFDKPQMSDAAHIAAWHPVVALAVADWLDAEAEEIPPGATHYRDGLIGDAPATKVARAFLGRVEAPQSDEEGEMAPGAVREAERGSEPQNGDLA